MAPTTCSTSTARPARTSITSGVQPAAGRGLRKHRPEPVPRARRMEPRLLAVPCVPDRQGGPKRVEFRVEVFNLLNHPNWGNPDGDVNSCHVRSDVLRRHRRSRCRHRRASDSARRSIPVLTTGCRLQASACRQHTAPAGTSVSAGVFFFRLSSIDAVPRGGACRARAGGPVASAGPIAAPPGARQLPRGFRPGDRARV